MKIDETGGIRVQQTITTPYVKTPDGETAAVTDRPENLRFEDCVQTGGIRKWLFDRGTPLPLNFMVDGIGKDGISAPLLGNRIDKAFQQYHSGVLDEKAVEKVISDIVSELRSTYADMGCDPDEFMPQLLSDVYDRAKISNIVGASNCSFQDSRALAAQYNGSDRNSRDVIYYDAKYYYQTEEMKTTLRESILRIGESYGITDLELSEPEPNNAVAKSIYYSYNTIINEAARHDLLIGNMIDENMVPPRDFRFFYKGNDAGTNIYSSQLTDGKDSDSFFDGVLHVWYGDWTFNSLVPVRMDATKYPVSVNMYDVVSGSGKEIPSEIVPALKNFDFFTMIQSGNYFKSHSRKLPY